MQDNINLPVHNKEKKQFTLPDKYFDDKPGTIQARIHQQDKSSFLPYIFKLKPVWWSALASITCVLLGIIWFGPNTLVASQNTTIADLNKQEIVMYLTHNVHQLETTDIAFISAKEPTAAEMLYTVSQEEIEAVLPSQNLDLYAEEYF